LPAGEIACGRAIEKLGSCGKVSVADGVNVA